MTAEQRPQDRYFKILAAVVAMLAFGYTCLRAFRLSITFDEAITYLVFARGPWATIWNGADVESLLANNHLLNTILVKILVGILGLSEWVVRLPALLGHLLYLVGMLGLLKRCFRRAFLLWAGLLLFSHPFLLDMFSLSRGYALSLGFLGLGLFFFSRWVPSKQNGADGKSLVWALLFMALSAISTFSFLSVYLGLVCVVLILEIRRGILRWKEGQPLGVVVKLFLWRGLVPIVIISLFLSLLIVKPILTLARENEFYFGGTAGFWQDTVTSLVFDSIYGVPLCALDLTLLGKCFLVISFAIYGVYLILRLRSKQPRDGRDAFLNAIVLFALSIVLIINLQHVLLGTKFPVERAAVFLIPLFLLFVLFLWQTIAARVPPRGGFFVHPLFAVATALLLLHNLLCLNFSHTLSWRYDASTKEAMETVYELSSPGAKTGRIYTLGVHWLVAPSAVFYVHRNKMSWVRWTRFKYGPEVVYTYHYLLDEERHDVPEWAFDFYYFPEEDRQFMVTTYHLKVIRSFDLSKTCLAIPGAGSRTN